MILFVNGCSHTDGTDWSCPKHLTWPSISRHNTIDWSRAGCSNDRIVRTTIEQICNPKYYDVDYVFIQFTDPTRFELPMDIDNGSCKGLYQEYKQIIPKAHSSGRLQNKDTAFCINHYSEPEQRALCDVKLLIHMISLQSFFQSLDINYGFMMWWPPQDKDFWRDAKIKRLWKTIDHTKIINADDSRIWSMDKMLEDRGYKRSEVIRDDGTLDRHFQEDAHVWLRHKIERFISTGQKVSHINTNTPNQEEIYRYG